MKGLYKLIVLYIYTYLITCCNTITYNIYNRTPESYYNEYKLSITIFFSIAYYLGIHNIRHLYCITGLNIANILFIFLGKYLQNINIEMSIVENISNLYTNIICLNYISEITIDLKYYIIFGLYLNKLEYITPYINNLIEPYIDIKIYRNVYKYRYIFTSKFIWCI